MVRRAMGGGALRAVVLTAFLVVPAATAAAAPPDGEVTIRRGPEGTPHIRATTYAALGYGYARAHAEDNLCVLADTYVTVRAERSQFFGPRGTYNIRNTDTTPNNLASDFFWAKVAKQETVEKLLAAPDGPAPEVREAVRGYTAGYNDFIAEDARRVGDPRCKGEPWVKPIDEIDVYRRFYQLGLLASQMVALDGIGNAQPPTPAAPSDDQAALRAVAATSPHELDRLDRPFGGGSNAIALGRDATDNGMGMLLGNPHQPWYDSERFFQSHLTIPGKVDVAGASLYGVPAINIGYTKDLAWSHTVSTARRFVILELQLVPGSPTTYLVDGQPKEMRRTTVTVRARNADGELEDRTRTLYDTELGPVVTSLQGLPIFPWTPGRAFVMFDANAENYGRLLNHFFEVNRAGSVEEVDRILRRYLGIPWVNTIAADRSGEAYYADIGAVPGVPDAKLATCSTPVGMALDNAVRVQVLDGARSSCAPDDDPAAPGRRILPASAQPSLRRTDYTENSNDSYWLSNARTRIEGYPRIIGEERTVRSPRTRMAFTLIEDQLANGGRFSLRSLQDAMFNNRGKLAELWRPELIEMCRGDSEVPPEACDALENWSGRDDINANGALLFRRFADRAIASNASPFSVPFDPEDPVGTPNGLDTTNPDVRKALRDAVADVEGANLPLDAPLRERQWEFRGERFSLHGGPDRLGLFNVIDTIWNARRGGYTGINYGATYIQAVQFTGSGCGLEARTVLAHSQSTDPTSRYFNNGTELFTRKQWVDQPFCEQDVEERTRLVARYGTESRSVLRRLLRGVRFRGGRLRFRLESAARVIVTVRAGRRLVRRITTRRGAGRHAIRLTLPAGRRYRLKVVARAGQERAHSVLRVGSRR